MGSVANTGYIFYELIAAMVTVLLPCMTSSVSMLAWRCFGYSINIKDQAKYYGDSFYVITALVWIWCSYGYCCYNI